MNDFKIIRSKPVDFKPYEELADKIFLKIYYELGWSTFFRFKKAKRLSLIYAMDIRDKLTNVGSVVISKSPKKLNAVRTFWDGVYSTINSISGIKKI